MFANAPVVKMSADCFCSAHKSDGNQDVQIDTFKQPTRVNTVGARNVPRKKASSFDDHANDRLVLLERVSPSGSEPGTDYLAVSRLVTRVRLPPLPPPPTNHPKNLPRTKDC